MFTGIVRERGRVVSAPVPREGGGARVVVGHSVDLASRLKLGASLAVAGVCLTVVEQGGASGVADGVGDGAAKGVADGVEDGCANDVAGRCATGVAVEDPRAWSAFDLSPETLGRTTLGTLRGGDEVNLEPPLSAGEPLGGHWVQGHVDATTRVARVEELGDDRVVGFEIPAELENGLVLKGSVTVDGVSLTVSALDDETFDVALIPHTLEVTTLSDLAPGDRVNVEGDILARYVRNSVEAAVAAALESAGR